MAKTQHRNPLKAQRDLPVVERHPEFKPDYTYVINNLKKIGIMAVCFIAFLVVLSFVL